MTTSDLIRLLAETNLALAAGVAIAVLARRWVRRLFGASAAYGLWLLPALAAAAVALPPRTVETAGQSAAASPRPITVLPELPAPGLAGVGLTPSPDVATLVLWGWIAGAVAMCLWLVAHQLRFMREVELGRAGPAVVGFLKPRIVTPAQFESRFTRREQLVVLAHERTHLLRGDAQVNGVVALLRCLCWFNPLAHLGAHLMRVDQELACDASVIARYPKSRAPYAQALLKAELAARPLPLGCYWPARAMHPLTERMAMLQRQPLHRSRRLAGAAGVGALAAAAGMAAWAAKPPEIVASMAAPRPAAALAEPAGARGLEPIGPGSAPLASLHAVPAPLPRATVAPDPQDRADVGAPGAVSPDVTQVAQAVEPSPGQEAEGRTSPRILLASLAPALKDTPRQRPAPSAADLPSWSRTPTADEMRAAYPPAAARVNYATSATLECAVAADGGLIDCLVANEGAPGFGSAALAVAPKFRLPTTSPSGASTVGRTVRVPIHWVNPATATAALTIVDIDSPVGTVAFNCRVRAGRTLDNCVLVDAKPRGNHAFSLAGEAALRFKAPANSAEFSRILVLVGVIPIVKPVTNALTYSGS